ncbi:MAG: ferritin-like domain-containing protein [bacterium]|nr:ferritin-like domain-containing protein [bacterium]MCP5070219.1 ferritin-like domain-containing protein [bacterium]
MDLSRFSTEARLQSHFKDDYDFGDDKLQTLYAQAKRHQWDADLDVDWGKFEPGVDVIDRRSDFMSRLACVQELPSEQQTQLFRVLHLFMVSQVLHGEQAAMMTCGQLVNVVPDVNAKLAASVQVVDEARHVEVFARYLECQGGRFPIDPDLKIILEELLAERDWEAKCVGMQVIIESVALSFFRLGSELGVEPVFKSFIGNVRDDESRHVAYGVITLQDRIPALAPGVRERLEDWAYDAIVRIGGRAGKPGFTSMLGALATTDVDFASFMPKFLDEISDQQHLDLDGLADPISDTVLPNLLRVGLVPERHVDGYLAQGWRVDRAAKTVENLHTRHSSAQEKRAEFQERGLTFADPREATLA